MKQLSKTFTFNWDIYSVTINVIPCGLTYSDKNYQYTVDYIVFTECGNDASSDLVSRELDMLERYIEKMVGGWVKNH